jgi:hypothetical protein
MFNLNPKLMVALGVLMMTIGGVIIPLLMVIHAIESNWFLIFGSYAVSVSGLYLGIIGMARVINKGPRR